MMDTEEYLSKPGKDDAMSKLCQNDTF